MVSSLFGGKGPGLVSVVLSCLAFDYVFLPPRYSFAMQPLASLRFTTFLGAVIVVAVLIEAKRKAEEACRQIDAKYRQVSDDALAQAQKSEAQLRLIIDSIPVPAWSSRADGGTDFINKRWLDYTGIPAEEALGRGWTAVCHPDDLDRTMEYWRSVMASHEDRELEARSPLNEPPWITPILQNALGVWPTTNSGGTASRNTNKGRVRTLRRGSGRL